MRILVKGVSLEKYLEIPWVRSVHGKKSFITSTNRDENREVKHHSNETLKQNNSRSLQ